MRGVAIAACALAIACSPRSGAEPTATAAEQAPASVETSAAAGGQPQTGLQQVPLTIMSASGTHDFTVDVAATPEQQQRGLMFVRSLPPDGGMIFPYDPPQPIGFWMKNTLIPLDLIFIRADGTIARIATAKPHDETTIRSGEPVAAVLEIAGGRAAELGIREGDRVSW